MDSYLISLVKQNIHIKELNKNFKFEVFEAIHLEYSFKYSKDNNGNWNKFLLNP